MGETSERVAKLMDALGPWAIGDASDAEGARILREALDAARREGAESALPAADLARGARTVAQRDLVRVIGERAGSALAEATEYEFRLLATREGQLVAECERLKCDLDTALELAAGRDPVPGGTAALALASVAASVAQDDATALRAECERLREACHVGQDLSRWAASIHWDGRPNTPIWLQGLRDLIDRTQDACRAALAPPPAAVGRNVYACGCSGSDDRCPLHGDYPAAAKGAVVGDETVLYSDRELAREVCALFDAAHGGTPMAVLADRIARRVADFRRACIAAPVERAERAERERDALIAAWPGGFALRDAAVRAAAGLDAGREDKA